MILNNALIFAIVMVVTWMNMFISRAVASIFLSKDKANIAAYAFLLGSLAAISRGSFGSDVGVGLLSGIIVAYASVWWACFGRNRRVAAQAEL